MKSLRIALSLLACVVLCLCLSPAGNAEDVAVSDVAALNAHGVYVNEDNFPDENFRNYVIQKYGTYLSSGEIAAATVIDCSKSYSISYDNIDIDNPDEETPADTPGDLIFYIPDNTDGNQEYPSTESDNDEVITPYPQSTEGETFIFQSSESENPEPARINSTDEAGRIKSLKGIEYFTELEELSCAGNALPEINLRNNTKLKKLNCAANILSNLDLSCNPYLTTLNCAYNILSELDLSNNTELINLDCSYNSLCSLNIRNNTALRSINCYTNLLASLDLSSKISLRIINCANNQIDYLNIEECPLLLKCVMENEPELNDGELCYVTIRFYRLDDYKALTVDDTVKLIPINCFSINETNFPDASFLTYVAETFDLDEDSFLCKEEIEAATDMNCSGKTIQSLKGLEFFNKLKNLNCSNNDIEYLTISQSPSLVTLINSVQPEISDTVTMYSDGDACLIYDTATVLMDIINPQWIINKSNFPDMIFREYVSNVIDLDSNGYLNEDEVDAVTWIDCSGKGEDRGNIESLQGIEVFSNLELLDCSYNRLRELNVSKNRKLKTLDCSTNDLEGYLDVTDNTELETVWCYGNRLEDIDLGANEKLVELWCNDNQLALLDISELPGLKVLWCDTNMLTELDTTGNPDLETLSCANNRIDHLNLEQNTALKTLWCFGNRIEELNLIHNPGLKRLGCYANYMSELDISPCAKLCELVGNRSHTIRDGAVYYFDESSNDPVYLQYDEGAILITPQAPDFTLPASLTSIDSEAFAGGAFTYVLVPATATEIGPRAFAGCPKLRYVELLNPNTGIDLSAFEGVTDVTVIGASETTAAAFVDVPDVSFKPAA